MSDTEPTPSEEQPDLSTLSISKSAHEEYYQACMILALVGDAVGYRNGRWEFRLSTQVIHDELAELTNGKGMSGLKVTRGGEWCVSDDSVMHLATAEALTIQGVNTLTDIAPRLASKYKGCYNDMTGRAPGKTTGKMCRVLQADGKNWSSIPFNSHGGGCGGAMRIACIGLRFPKPSQRDDLIALAVEACRMTHHHPVAYLGAVCAALFTSLAIQRVHPTRWGAVLLDTIPRVRAYIEHADRSVKANLAALDERAFELKWEKFLGLRRLPTSLSHELKGQDQSTPCVESVHYPEPYGVPERDVLYRELSFRGVNPGSSGYDVVLIPYDALLGCRTWNECCHWAVLHAGDNDTTGTIAGAWWGAYYGFKGVASGNYDNIEYKGRALTAANKLLRKAARAPRLGIEY